MKIKQQLKNIIIPEQQLDQKLENTVTPQELDEKLEQQLKNIIILQEQQLDKN